MQRFFYILERLLLITACFSSFSNGAAASYIREKGNEISIVKHPANPSNGVIVFPLGNSDAVSEKQPELFEGDIADVDVAHLIKTHQMRQVGSKSGLVNEASRWYGGTVRYAISTSFSSSERTTIIKAIEEFQKTATIRFSARTNQNDYVNIIKGSPGSGCFSSVGRKGGAQTLNLAPNCVSHDTVVHELMHAVGFYHEQSRSDRDKYVEINLSNIPTEKQHNFLKYDSSFVTNFNQPYDYGSIMHYKWNAFATNQNIWTIRGRGAYQGVVLGNDRGLTPTDIKKIDLMYPLCARLYADANYGGSTIAFVKGEKTNIAASFEASSAYVVSGCTFIICTRDDQSGHCASLKTTSGSWYSNLAGYDNLIRSVKCVC